LRARVGADFSAVCQGAIWLLGSRAGGRGVPRRRALLSRPAGGPIW